MGTSWLAGGSETGTSVFIEVSGKLHRSFVLVRLTKTGIKPPCTGNLPPQSMPIALDNFSEGKEELFGHAGPLTTPKYCDNQQTLNRGPKCVLWKEKIPPALDTGAVSPSNLHLYVSWVLVLKWITASYQFAKYNEHIKIPKIYFVMQTFLELTGQHFRWEIVPSWKAFPFSNIKIEQRDGKLFSISVSDKPWCGKTKKKKIYRIPSWIQKSSMFSTPHQCETGKSGSNMMSCHSNNSTSRLWNFHLLNISISQNTLIFLFQSTSYFCYFLVIVTHLSTSFNIYNLHTSIFLNRPYLYLFSCYNL